MFVDLAAVCPDIILDIRYATGNNFLGRAVYSNALCLLHPEVAKALSNVQKELKKQHLGLKVFDGYRPLSVQQLMWDIVQDERYVSNPKKNGGRHTRGTAVDVTLVDKQGNELEMPTAFDDFTERADSSYTHLSPVALKNRALLKESMAHHHFSQLPSEWWHFDYEGWQDDKKFPPQDLPLS